LILAFFLNRHFVFNAKNFKLIFSKQLKSFINLRLVTGVFDLFFVFIMVEYLSYSANYIKPVSSAIVIILNYLISKLIVFI
jgi:putative flippase GtrA